MEEVQLPISKSIANRLLILQAMHGQPLMDVTDSAIPDDVRILHDCLEAIAEGATEIQVGDCGTAMRFLTAYCAQLPDRNILLRGSKRMNKRPIIQEVNALMRCGADIWYEGEVGYPPLRIHGKKLHNPTTDGAISHRFILNDPQSSQFVSALLLAGFRVESNCHSPYISMTKSVIERFERGEEVMEYDWSSAAFWYEYVAIHGGQLHLNGLTEHSIQGDVELARLFKRFGVGTSFDETGAIITKVGDSQFLPLVLKFDQFPDLYPAIAMTCKQLGVFLIARHTAMLRIKESDRLDSFKHLQSNRDHRMAMALLVAKYPVKDEDIDCIRKSYPTFYEQLCAIRLSSRGAVLTTKG